MRYLVNQKGGQSPRRLLAEGSSRPLGKIDTVVQTHVGGTVDKTLSVKAAEDGLQPHLDLE